ncbi:competence protein ComEC, partial [Rhizobium sp. CRIBSB]|nr:competence protein ComEC [Rhizobium sp. CRIBSB]
MTTGDDTVIREGSIRAVLIPPGAGIPSRVERLRAWLRAQAEAQSLRWRLWAPVALGAGCATYFGLKVEPPLWPLMLGAVVAIGLWGGARRLGRSRAWTLPLMLLACFASGLMIAKLRTGAVNAPIAPAMAEPTTLEAWVIDVDSPG